MVEASLLASWKTAPWMKQIEASFHPGTICNAPQNYPWFHSTDVGRAEGNSRRLLGGEFTIWLATRLTPAPIKGARGQADQVVINLTQLSDKQIKNIVTIFRCGPFTNYAIKWRCILIHCFISTKSPSERKYVFSYVFALSMTILTR